MLAKGALVLGLLGILASIGYRRGRPVVSVAALGLMLLVAAVLCVAYTIAVFAVKAGRESPMTEKTRDRGEIIYLTVRNNLAVAWKFSPLGRAFLLTLWRST